MSLKFYLKAASIVRVALNKVLACSAGDQVRICAKGNASMYQHTKPNSSSRSLKQPYADILFAK
jgi:hypothetical protein